jgi:hypothetical protein
LLAGVGIHADLIEKCTAMGLMSEAVDE